MGLLRHRDHGDNGMIRYQMREKLVSLGDDSWIEDAAGTRAFKANGKVARLRHTVVLEDPHGTTVATVKNRPIHLRDVTEIDLGDHSAKVKKALVGFRDRFHVEVDGAPDLKVRGNILDHEYEIEQDGTTVAVISKKWFRVRDTYGVEVDPSANIPLVLAITIAVDDMSHD
jgi:uncharacterized protein YxjI